MPHVSEEHPRYRSLKVREDLVHGFRKGLVAEAGLIAHGRGEALDYLLGEESRLFALQAEKVAVAALLVAKNPIISVNGNTTALVASQIVQLAKTCNAKIEVNLFHRTVEREEQIRDFLIENGANTEDILGVAENAEVELPGIASPRKNVAAEGINQADCLLVPLEDGDRTEALRKMNKTVIAIDLNPLSRTAQMASITIVDNIVRAIPQMINLVDSMVSWKHEELQQTLESYNNQEILKKAFAAIEARLVSLSDFDSFLQ